MHLQITPEEAQLIDGVMKGESDDFDKWRDFLFRVGWCIVLQKPRVVEVDTKLLWYLRAKIDIYATVGEVPAGKDLIGKIYKTLLSTTNLQMEEYELIEESDDRKILIPDNKLARRETQD